MNYLKPSFSVPATGKAPADCKHGWMDMKRGRCIMCGVAMVAWSGDAAFNEWEAKETPIAPTDWHSGGSVVEGPGFRTVVLNGFGKR